MGNPIFLYDGVCGLCNRTVQFVLRHDRQEKFRFASLQGGFARQTLARHGANAADLDTVYVVMNAGTANESLMARSDATLFVLRELGVWWRAFAWLLKLLPLRVRDSLYNLVARNRYRIFGRYDVCPVPSDRERARFVDVGQ